MKALGLFALVALLSVTAHAEHILIIGDSISCGPFGIHTVDNLTKDGNQVTLYCAVSSTPSNWLNGKRPAGQKCMTMKSGDRAPSKCGGTGDMPNLKSLLAKHHGSRMMVALGTNSLLCQTQKGFCHYPSSGSKYPDHSYKVLADMVYEASNRCEWIGPPHLRPEKSVKAYGPGRVANEESNVHAFYASMEPKLDGSCTLVDSRPFTDRSVRGYSTQDGIHPSEEGGKLWAAAISSELRGHGEKPKRETGAGFDSAD